MDSSARSRLNPEPGFESGRLRLRFVLDVCVASIEPRRHHEKHGCDEHDLGEEEEIACPLQFQASIGILDEKIDSRSEDIAERYCPKIGAHHQRLHFLWGLSIGELQVHYGYHDLGRRERDKRQELPNDMRSLAGVYSDLNPAHD